jgi:hypothetical protein
MADQLEEGMKLHAKYYDGEFYPATVVTVSESQKRSKKPVKVHFVGYEDTDDAWCGLDELKSKKLPKAAPKAKAKAKATPKAKSKRKMGWERPPKVKVGDEIPDVSFDQGFPPEKINLKEFCKERKVILIGLPGAFTPT